MALKLIIILLAAAITSFSQQIIEPCELTDYSCISYILSANSDCNRNVWGSVPSKIGYNNFHFEEPYFNATFYDQYTFVKNLDKCVVSAFFFNLDTNVLVMAIDCPDLEVEAHRVLIQYQQLGQIRYFGFQVTQKFTPLIMTMNLPHADELDLCSGFVSTYVTGLTQYKVIPSDPAAEYVLSKESGLVQHQDVFVREETRYLGQPLFKLFVNSLLCDFDHSCLKRN